MNITYIFYIQWLHWEEQFPTVLYFTGAIQNVTMEWSNSRHQRKFIFIFYFFSVRMLFCKVRNDHTQRDDDDMHMLLRCPNLKMQSRSRFWFSIFVHWIRPKGETFVTKTCQQVWNRLIYKINIEIVIVLFLDLLKCTCLG